MPRDVLRWQGHSAWHCLPSGNALVILCGGPGGKSAFILQIAGGESALVLTVIDDVLPLPRQDKPGLRLFRHGQIGSAPLMVRASGVFTEFSL